MTLKESFKNDGLEKSLWLSYFWGVIEALRPKTLTASFVPVMVGTLLSGISYHDLNYTLVLSLLFTAFFIQTGTNLVNDGIDFDKKADTDERLGPIRMVQRNLLTSRQVYIGGLISFFFAALTSIPMISMGGPLFAIILGLSILSGYIYTGGPYPIAYNGLGEVFVLAFFGIVLTASATYLQIESLTVGSLIAGTQIGLLSCVLIAINNLRDINQDKKADKRTLAVRFGQTFGRYEITLFLIIPYLLNFYWLERGGIFFILPFLTLPIAVNLIRNIFHHKPSRLYNRFLQDSALLHITFGLMLSLGEILS